MAAPNTTMKISRILCPMGLVNRDDPQASAVSLRALSLAGDLAKTSGATVYSMYVVPIFVMHMTGFEEEEDPSAPNGIRWVPLSGGGIHRDSPEKIARERVAEYVRTTLPPGVKGEVVVRIGDPAKRILQFREEAGIDLIMMPAKRDTGDGSTALGTVTYKVVSHVPCSVAIIR